MKKLLIALSVVMGLASCNDNSFKINVNLDNSNEKTVYLKRYCGEQLKTIDSIKAKNNKAVFVVEKNDNTDAYLITMQGWRRPIAVFADNQNVKITGDCQNVGAINVAGTETQALFNVFVEKYSTLENEIDIHNFTYDFVKENITNPVGAYVMYNYKWSLNYDDLSLLYTLLPKDMECGYKVLINNYINKLSLTISGKKYLNFLQKDVNGETFKLSSIVSKNKIVMLDFWASWCPDCRKENPNIVALYDKFKDKGLEIVSISLDNDEAAWKKAIADDNLYWKHHVSDLKGWNNTVAEEYSISFIPQNVFINKSGIIVNRNVPTEKLMGFVEDALNND